MHFNAVDVIVLAAFVLLAIDGTRRGFVFYGTELLALGIGAAVALGTFDIVGRLFAEVLAVGQPMADLAASLLILVVVHVLVQLVLGPLIGRVGGAFRRLLGRTPYAIVSIVPALAVAVLLTLLVVGGLAAVPASPIRGAVRASFVGGEVVRIDLLQRRLRILLTGPGTAHAATVRPASETAAG